MHAKQRRAVYGDGLVRVLHVITGLETGGAEVMLARLLSATDRQRFRHVVVSLRDNGVLGADIEALGIPVHALGMPAGTPTLAGLRLLAAHWRAFRPDVVQGWLYHANLAVQCASPLAGWRAPVVWGIHHSVGNLRDQHRQTILLIRLGALLSQRPAGTIFVSERSLAEHRRLGYRPRRGVIIPNGFDTTAFRPSAEARRALRTELGVADSTPLIGLAARYHPMKNHDGFLRAAALLAATHPDSAFVLAGTDVTPANAALAAALASSGLGDRVHLLGPRRDMPDLLAGLDVLSTSSLSGEAFPLVVGEAMACGIPCVATDLGDCAELIGDTGLVVQPGDDRALAAAWRTLLDSGAAARTRRGAAARARVMARYSLTAVAGRYDALYHDLARREQSEELVA